MYLVDAYTAQGGEMSPELAADLKRLEEERAKLKDGIILRDAKRKHYCDVPDADEFRQGAIWQCNACKCRFIKNGTFWSLCFPDSMLNCRFTNNANINRRAFLPLVAAVIAATFVTPWSFAVLLALPLIIAVIKAFVL